MQMNKTVVVLLTLEFITSIIGLHLRIASDMVNTAFIFFHFFFLFCFDGHSDSIDYRLDCTFRVITSLLCNAQSTLEEVP